MEEALKDERRLRDQNGRASTSEEVFHGLSISTWLDDLNRSVLVTADGVRLNVYHAGTPAAHAVLLVNPIGVSMLLSAPLLRYLSRDNFVIAWETRGLPSAAPDTASMDVQDHVSDVAALLRHFSVDRVDVVSFDSGLLIALALFDRGGVNASRAVFVSASMLVGGNIPKTDYQRRVLPLWREALRKGPNYSAVISRMMAPRPPRRGDIDAELDYVNRLPFVDGHITHRYARLLARANEIDCSQILRRLRLPVLLVHAADDELIHVELAHHLQRRLRNATLHIVEHGGHYAVCKDESMRRAIGNYLTDPFVSPHPPASR